MRTFTAKDFNSKPGPVYRAAQLDGQVNINHDHYPELVFTVIARPRHQPQEAGDQIQQANKKITL